MAFQSTSPKLEGTSQTQVDFPATPIQTSNTAASVTDYVAFTNGPVNDVSLGQIILKTRLGGTSGRCNCYLNVIIQSLWHLRRFQEMFQRMFEYHDHVGKPCVVCALYCAFYAMRISSDLVERKVVDPASLRIALETANPNFQKMEDASKILEIIFDHLHDSFPYSGGGDAKLEVDNGVCRNDRCIPQSLSGMNIYESINCNKCQSESKKLKYTSYLHWNVANELRAIKISCTNSTFSELLHYVCAKDQMTCATKAHNYGMQQNIQGELSTPPHVFTASLDRKEDNSPDEISATLAAISYEVDIGVLHNGVNKGSKQILVSMVCYCDGHCICFIRSYQNKGWVLISDEGVEVIGGWNDVLTRCNEQWQPLLLFYECED